MIAKTLATLKTSPSKSKNMFRKICQDILTSETSRIGSKTNQEKVKAIVDDLIEQYLLLQTHRPIIPVGISAVK